MKDTKYYQTYALWSLIKSKSEEIDKLVELMRETGTLETHSLLEDRLYDSDYPNSEKTFEQVYKDSIDGYVIGK